MMRLWSRDLSQIRLYVLDNGALRIETRQETVKKERETEAKVRLGEGPIF